MATEGKLINEEDHKSKDEAEEQKNNNAVFPTKFLDEFILFNILTRIPADLIQTNFKCQCRQWRRLVSYEDFINTNFCRSKQGIIYMDQVKHGYEYTYLLKYMELSGSEILRVCKLHDFNTTLFTIKSSCNGLLLMQEYPSAPYHIMNPVTKKHTTIAPMKNYYFCELVFHGEYKVVELYDPKELDWDGRRSSYHDLRITTFNGQPDKHIQVPEKYSGTYKGSHVYINGSLYWAVENHIVSLDLETKTFHILQTPIIGRMYRFNLIKLFGSLSLVELLYKSIDGAHVMVGTNVWSMVGGEWEIVFTLNDTAISVVGFLDHANLFIYKDSHGKLGAYDVKTKQPHSLVDEHHWCIGHKVHVNSFLSLSCMV